MAAVICPTEKLACSSECSFYAACSGGLKLREGDQQLPVPNDELDIQTQVIADIEARRLVGIQRYGVALQPFNQRDAVRDLYEELIDGAMYAKQWLVERERLLEQVHVLTDRVAELEQLRDELGTEVQTLEDLIGDNCGCI